MKNTFKKITSVILAMFILMSVSVTAFAAPGSGEYVGGNAYQSELVAREIYEKYEDEEELWDYDGDNDGHLYRYTDEDGTVWRYFSDRNYIVCKENEKWLYRTLEDGTIAVRPNPDVEWTELEVTIPSVLDGRTVTILDRFGSSDAISVIVPDTVTELGYNCFNNTSVKRAVLPKTINATNVNAFATKDFDIEIYYCGTETEWKSIIAYNIFNTWEHEDWAVTGFDWLNTIYRNDYTDDYTSGVKAIYYNVDLDTLTPVEDLIEEEPVEPTIWDKIAQAFENFADSIVVFFEKVANFFADLFA